MSFGDDTLNPQNEIEAILVINYVLKNLLAIIHGDGGHHTQKVGLLQSIKDACEIVIKDRDKLANFE